MHHHGSERKRHIHKNASNPGFNRTVYALENEKTALLFSMTVPARPEYTGPGPKSSVIFTRHVPGICVSCERQKSSIHVKKTVGTANVCAAGSLVPGPLPHHIGTPSARSRHSNTTPKFHIEIVIKRGVPEFNEVRCQPRSDNQQPLPW
jgi:hypothetical protein